MEHEVAWHTGRSSSQALSLRLLPLAARNLTRNRRRTLISLGALVLGVASMVAMRGFFNGVQRINTGLVVEGQVGAVQIHRRGYLRSMEGLPLTLDLLDTPALREQILRTPGVTAVAGRIVFGATSSRRRSGGWRRGASVASARGAPSRPTTRRRWCSTASSPRPSG